MKEKEKQNIVKHTATNVVIKFFEGHLLLVAMLLCWAVMMTFYVGILVERQQSADQSEAFRGRYLNMSIEGLSVLQQQLSKTNVRLSAVESEIEKGKKAPELIDEGAMSFPENTIQHRCGE